MRRMAFLDLETTGLEDELNNTPPARILECGIVIVDLPTFEVVAEKAVVFAFKAEAPNMPTLHPRVVEMHTASGLLEACRRSCTTMYDGKVELCKFVAEHDAQGSPLAGANPSFDRAFMRSWLPELEELFHYRNFDTNSFWMLDQIIRGEDETAGKPATAHRAIADCYDAIRAVERHFGFVTELVKGAQ